jgi:hypothetical protein
MEELKFWCTLVLCVSSLISCGLWLGSALVKVRAEERQDETGMLEFSISEVTDSGVFDVLETARRQAKWNKWAAVFAAIAAACQAIASYIPAN